MRIYETIFIVKPDAPEEELEASIEQATSTITAGGGTINNVDKWGKRRLAYRVQRYLEGYYVFVNYSVEENAGLSKEVERRMKVADPIIKFMTVRIDQELKRLEKMRQKREKRASKKRSREPASAERKARPAEPAAPAKPASSAKPVPSAEPAAPAKPAPSAKPDASAKPDTEGE